VISRLKTPNVFGLLMNLARKSRSGPKGMPGRSCLKRPVKGT